MFSFTCRIIGLGLFFVLALACYSFVDPHFYNSEIDLFEVATAGCAKDAKNAELQKNLFENGLSPKHPAHASQKQKPYRYKLAVAAIFQNDAPYLKEWIEFHRLVGVEHFYLYNNLSTDNYKEVLRPYIKSGVVQLIEWPFESNDVVTWNGIQNRAYEHAIRLAKKKAKWVAFLDTDEFLFPVKEENLISFLVDYEDFGGVTANWVMFGTSFISKIPEDKLLIETLVLRANVMEHCTVKSIVRPECIQGCTNPHFFIYEPGYFQVNADKVAFVGPFSPYVGVDRVRINHYWTRDEYYFNTFKIPKRKKWGDNITQECVNALSQVYDDAILHFVAPLKNRLRK